jgi:hypothetical protein
MEKTEMCCPCPIGKRAPSLCPGTLVRSARHRKKENEDKTIFVLIQMKTEIHKAKFVLCIDNRECDDLEKGKVYRVIQDDDAVREGYIRIVDESSEDHLYPASYFVALDLPRKAQDALFASLDGENRPTNAST